MTTQEDAVKKTARMALVAGLACLALTACGERGDSDDASDDPTETETSSAPAESHPDFKACMVSDSGGFDDKSFNQTSHDGLLNAKENLGIQTGEVESQSDTEYADNINELVKQSCNQITTVGFLLGDATEAAAKKNTGVESWNAVSTCSTRVSGEPGCLAQWRPTATPSAMPTSSPPSSSETSIGTRSRSMSFTAEAV